MSVDRNLGNTPLAISANNILQNKEAMNIGAGLNADGTLKSPIGNLASPSTQKAAPSFGWVGAVSEGIGNIAKSLQEGAQKKKQEKELFDAQRQNLKMKAQQNTMMMNNNFNNLNNLPLGVRKNGV